MATTNEMMRKMRNRVSLSIRRALRKAQGLSVSRVGGSAQKKAMRKVAGTLKLSLAQYREMAAFSQFGSDLDEATQEQLANGDRQVEMLKQGQYSPMSMEEQVVAIYAAMPPEDRDSWVRKLDGDDLRRFETEMLAHIRAHHSEILETIRKSQKLEEEVEAQLIAALDGFAEIFQPSAGSDAA